MKSIDFLEHGGGQMHLRIGGALIPLADPRRLHYQILLGCLEQEIVPDLPPLPFWQLPLVFPRWRAAWDLPAFADARRLAYLVDHYRAAIANDLQVTAHLDLGDLWRARRWTLLLDVIDRLPAHSWYASSVSMDEEHARLMAEAIMAREANGEEPEAKGPSLTGWTPEVAVLTNVLDATRRVEYAVYAAQHGKKAGEPPKPSPRPVTPLESALKRAEFNRRQAKHQALVARVLPHKR